MADDTGRHLAHVLQEHAQSIDTTTSGGLLVFHLFGVLAEFEWKLIRERTRAGLISARARGRKGGRPKRLDPRRIAMARAIHADHQTPVADICRTLGVSRSAFYRSLRPAPSVAPTKP